jgi:hypothetical protein
MSVDYPLTILHSYRRSQRRVARHSTPSFAISILAAPFSQRYRFSQRRERADTSERRRHHA